MITIDCECGNSLKTPETDVNKIHPCPRCGKAIGAVSAETLPEGSGAGDFDAFLEMRSGPAGAGAWFVPGGCADIEIGKQEGNTVVLPGKMVSRKHCKLARVDFGPSRWRLIDNQSTNGLFVNGERIGEKELAEGDVIRIGEYELVYRLMKPAARPAARVGPVCPSCGKQLGVGAKICVACGVDVRTGKPLITTQALDENAVHENTHTVIVFISWIMWVTLFPIPLISEAFGKRKPWTIRSIAILTVAASLVYLLATWSNEKSAAQFMLWPPGAKPLAGVHFELPAEKVQEMIDDLSAEERIAFDQKVRDLRGRVPEDQLNKRAMEALFSDMVSDQPYSEFHWWQLLTHALLHDNSSILGFIFHLGGNMLFLMVFGTRVNALIGNAAMVIIYPLLAVASAGAYLILGGAQHPMLGASGAINGLAGMYLILFPTQKVHCAMWIRFRWWLAYKIFTLRGFWVLGIYVAYDILMVVIQHQLHVSTGTAHWAHLGGFGTGIILALGLLLSRQFDTGGGDLLSVILGRRAWALIGKPSKWAGAT